MGETTVENPNGQTEDEQKVNFTADVVTGEGWKRTVRIEVAADSVEKEYTDAIKELGRNAQIHGFRKGHVPRPLLLKQFGESLLDELKVRLISLSTDDAFEQNDIEAVSEPVLGLYNEEDAPEATEDAEEGDEAEDKVFTVKDLPFDEKSPFGFAITIEVKPTFDIPEYKGLSVTRTDYSVEETKVDEYIATLRRSSAEYEPITEGGALPGDRLTVKATLTTKEDSEEIWSVDSELCHLVEDKLLGLAASVDRSEVEGIAVGEERSFEVTVPNHFKEEAHRGKEATLTVEPVEVNRAVLSELDDEAAKALGADSVDALRTQVRERLEERGKADSTADLEKQIVDQLTENAEFELPEGMLEREARSQEMRSLMSLAQMGLPLDSLDEAAREEMKEEAKTNSVRALKANLILEKIAKSEEISVDDNEVEERIYNIAMQTRTTPVAVRSRLEREGNLDSLKNEVLHRKVLNYLVEQADITDA